MKAKRIISLLLSVVMLFSVLSFDAFAKNPEEKTNDKYDHIVGLLTSLGIIDDVDAYGRSESFVTRGEFAQLLVRLDNADVENLTSNVAFGDVSEELMPYVSYVYNMGYMASRGSRFAPDSYVTDDEVIYALVNMLGFGTKAKLEGGDSDAYMRVAEQIDLTKSVTFYGKDKRVPLKYMLQMFYNTLTGNMLKISQYGESTKFEATESFMEKKFDLYYIEGRITGNNLSAFEGSKTSEGCVSIDGIGYGVGNTDASNHLGYMVKAYYMENDQIDKTLVYVDYKSFCEEITFHSTEAIYDSLLYRYEDQNEKTQKAKLATDVITILNGVYTPYRSEMMLPAEGEITLVNTDNDKEFEVVIITSAVIGIVNSYNPLNKQLSIKMINENGEVEDKYYDFLDFEEENIEFLDVNQREMKDTAITEGIVITIYENAHSIRIIIGGKTVSGVAKGIREDELKIDEETYKISPLYIAQNGTRPVHGVYGMYYLDANGRVISFKIVDSEWKYGYILKPTKVEDDEETTCVFKMFTQGSTGSVTLKTAEKFYVDGDRCDECGVRKKDGADVVSTIFNKSQLIRYKLNDEGKITHIDTDETSEDASQPKEGLRLYDDQFSRNVQYVGFQFGTRMGVKKSAIIVFVPNDDEVENATDAMFYSFGVPSNLVNNIYYKYKAYTLDDDSIAADVLIVKRYFEPETTSTMGVVQGINKIINEDDEIVEELVVSTVAGEVTYRSREDNWFSNKNLSEKDAVRIATDGAGYAANVELVYDWDSDDDEGVLVTTGKNTATQYGDGYVFAKNDGFIGIKKDPQSASETMQVFDTSSAAILICDTTASSPICSKGTVADMMDYKSFGSTAQKDMIVYHTRYSKLQTIIIYKR